MSLANALLKAGLVDQNAYDAEEARKRTEEERLKKSARQAFGKSHLPVNTLVLDTCASVNVFRRTVLELLVIDPGFIDQAIENAHRFEDGPSRKKLIWQMYQVRDGLKTCPEAQRERFIRRALRRAGGTFEEPKG